MKTPPEHALTSNWFNTKISPSFFLTRQLVVSSFEQYISLLNALLLKVNLENTRSAAEHRLLQQELSPGCLQGRIDARVFVPFHNINHCVIHQLRHGQKIFDVCSSPRVVTQ